METKSRCRLGGNKDKGMPLRSLQETQQEAEVLGIHLCKALQVLCSGHHIPLLEPEQPTPGAGCL